MVIIRWMMRARLLVVLLSAVSAGWATAQTRTVDIFGYEAEIRPDIAGKAVRGKVAVNFTTLAAGVTELVLNAGNLEVDAVKRNGRPLRYEKSGAKLTIQLASPVRKGKAARVE